MAVALACGDDVESLERGRQLPRRAPVGPRSDVDLAQHRDREQTSGGEAVDDGLVETCVPEQVTQDQVDVGTLREASIEVGDLERAAFADTGAVRELSSEVDRDRRHVDSVDVHAPARQPHGAPPPPAGDLERAT